MTFDFKAVGAYLKRNLTLAICVVIFSLLLAILYIRSGEPESVESSLKERSDLLRRLKANVVNSAQLDSQLRVLSGINQTIATNALRVGDLAQNLKLFYELESNSGVKLTDVRPLVVAATSKTPSQGVYTLIPFSLTIEGDFRQLMLFLRSLESGPQFCRFLHVTIPTSLDFKQKLTLEIELLGVRS